MGLEEELTYKLHRNASHQEEAQSENKDKRSNSRITMYYYYSVQSALMLPANYRLRCTSFRTTIISRVSHHVTSDIYLAVFSHCLMRCCI
jgi:hypothetical protein